MAGYTVTRPCNACSLCSSSIPYIRTCTSLVVRVLCRTCWTGRTRLKPALIKHEHSSTPHQIQTLIGLCPDLVVGTVVLAPKQRTFDTPVFRSPTTVDERANTPCQWEHCHRVMLAQYKRFFNTLPPTSPASLTRSVFASQTANRKANDSIYMPLPTVTISIEPVQVHRQNVSRLRFFVPRSLRRKSIQGCDRNHQRRLLVDP